MKAITICQPYASLIVGWPDMGLNQLKRVENRSWPTRYRGPLLIHSGLSRKWLASWEGPTPARMPFGMIVGCVNLAGCLSMEQIDKIPDGKPMDWLKTHVHATGPYCWILRHARRLLSPIPYRGQQGFFEVPDDNLWGLRWEPQCKVCGVTNLDVRTPGGVTWAEEDLCANCAEKHHL